MQYKHARLSALRFCLPLFPGRLFALIYVRERVSHRAIFRLNKLGKLTKKSRFLIYNGTPDFPACNAVPERLC
jgi:hypothetical protein